MCCYVVIERIVHIGDLVLKFIIPDCLQDAGLAHVAIADYYNMPNGVFQGGGWRDELLSLTMPFFDLLRV